MSKNPSQFQEMRYDCAKEGCFNLTHRLNFRYFYDCLPGRISFTDIDGIVEIDGKGLMLEMKSTLKDLPRGQQIMFERLTNDRKLTVICIVGTDQGMAITEMGTFFGGRWSGWKPAGLFDVREAINRWVKWVKKGNGSL